MPDSPISLPDARSQAGAAFTSLMKDFESRFPLMGFTVSEYEGYLEFSLTTQTTERLTYRLSDGMYALFSAFGPAGLGKRAAVGLTRLWLSKIADYLDSIERSTE